MVEGPCADSEEKREPVGDIDTAVVDSLKALDPNRPIREADIQDGSEMTRLTQMYGPAVRRKKISTSWR